VSATPAPAILLASRSPQRRAILEQLRIPFDVVTPPYEERDVFAMGSDPAAFVRLHAHGKAHSVAGDALERPVLGVDTAVFLDGRVYGKPRDAADAERMLEALAGRTHHVVSGLCLLTPAWEELHAETTAVTFRSLTARDIATYLAAEEWRDRAGAYAIQCLGGALVERIDGDYLNVVGLPGALLTRLLASRFSGIYGFG
jgi:nucleoside triphosphate pyrophosphatase